MKLPEMTAEELIEAVEQLNLDRTYISQFNALLKYNGNTASISMLEVFTLGLKLGRESATK